jgi:aryl-alcohol dehydrogenase-like predicted oxidoreductase
VKAYVELARAHELDPAQMALAYVISRQFVTAAIMGATTLEQMKLDIDASRVTLSAEVLDALEQIHKVYTYPCP